MPFQIALPDLKHGKDDEKGDCCCGSSSGCAERGLFENGYASRRQRARSIPKPRDTRLDLGSRADAGPCSGRASSRGDIDFVATENNVHATIERNLDCRFFRIVWDDVILEWHLYEEEHEA
jgi:hypothetical protein